MDAEESVRAGISTWQKIAETAKAAEPDEAGIEDDGFLWTPLDTAVLQARRVEVNHILFGDSPEGLVV